MSMWGELNKGFSCILLLCEEASLPKMVNRGLTIFTTCGSFFRSHGAGDRVLEGTAPSLFLGLLLDFALRFPQSQYSTLRIISEYIK